MDFLIESIILAFKVCTGIFCLKIIFGLLIGFLEAVFG